MASITAPTSLQIRLAFTATNCCTKFPLLLHSRLRHVDRRPRLLCVAENGNGLDTTPSWVGSNGWPDSEVGKLSTKKNESHGGVGVAGLLLSGLTFSALFISRRRISTRQEQQMKPVTTHQEVLLLSDDHKDETAHLNAGNVVGQGNGTMEGQVDISMDYSSPESDSIPNCYRTIDDSSIGSQFVYDDIRNMYNDTNANYILTRSRRIK